MTFSEKEDFSFPKLPCNMIYFLTLENEVVYVGQTTQGIVRPMLHKDKEYDEIKLIFTSNENLNTLEGYYISKYKPKYNSVITGYFSLLKARDYIRECVNNADFTVNDLKRCMRSINIEEISFNGISYISPYDLNSICKFLSDVRSD